MLMQQKLYDSVNIDIFTWYTTTIVMMLPIRYLSHSARHQMQRTPHIVLQDLGPAATPQRTASPQRSRP